MSHYLHIAAVRTDGFVPSPKGVNTKWNANTLHLVQDLNLRNWFHFLIAFIQTLRHEPDVTQGQFLSGKQNMEEGANILVVWLSAKQTGNFVKVNDIMKIEVHCKIWDVNLKVSVKNLKRKRDRRFMYVFTQPLCHVIQSQFLNRLKLIWIFLFLDWLPNRDLKTQFSLLYTHSWRSISSMWNANSFVHDLNYHNRYVKVSPLVRLQFWNSRGCEFFFVAITSGSTLIRRCNTCYGLIYEQNRSVCK